jgi:oligoendopeptidase F
MKIACKILLIILNFSALEARSYDMVRARTDVPIEERWNVEALYPNLDDWKNEFAKAKGKAAMPHWPDLKAFEGKLKESPDAVARFFDTFFDLDRRLSKLHTYASMRLDEDLGNDEFKQNYGLITSLFHDFQLEYSWVEPELLSLSEKEFQRLMKNAKLQFYRFYLEKIGRMRPHVLSPELEEMLALSGKALETPYKAFGALNNADLTFSPAETAAGEKRELTTGTYLLYLRDPDRELRKSAFINLHRGYEAHANTLCELIQGQIQGHLFAAKAKKFGDCREAALFPSNIDSAVYDNLIKAVHKNLGALHDYLRLRKEMLGLKEMHPYDLYVPLVEEVDANIDFKGACQMVVESVEPLGSAYSQALKIGLMENRWVDPFENQRKRSGAYSGGCYDSMPYILMNFHGTLNDILTLAHESGHSMHSYLSRKNQPFIYSSYSLFVAEVASTFNEQLLLKYLKEKAKTDQEKAYLINYEIEAIRTTIFRQTLFAEFELQIHRFAEQGITLTPTLLKETYLNLNRLYYGPDLILDSGIENEWARIPHFYYDFYVYQYATGLSAALALFEKAKSSEEATLRYLQFLSSGGSRYPLDLLQKAGVDLRDTSSIEAAMRHFALLVEELKKHAAK